MTKVITLHKQTYIYPAMEVVNIEMQQAILAGSTGTSQIETLGETKEEMEWSNGRLGERWGNLWE